MTPEQIQGFCIAGADAYLNFLVANNRGIQEIGLVRIEQVSSGERLCFKLVLQARLFNPETISVRLSPPGRDYGPKDFKVIEYDADAKCLLIETQNTALNLEQIPASEVKVISDLRFLVRNVKDWFQQHGREVTMPSQGQTNRDALGVDSSLPLEACQKEAIRVSLGSPLTYIWGPPGTGKTRHVLAAAVVGLLRSGKKVGIYAPTNNALEQALEAIILAGAESELVRDKVLRVGHPSAKFAQKFPEVCEIQGLRGQIAESRRQQQNYHNVLNHRRGATVLGSVAMLHHQFEELRTMLNRRREIGGLLAGSIVQKLLSRLKGEYQILERELVELERRIHGDLEVIRRTKTESTKLNQIVAELDFTNIEPADDRIVTLEAQTKAYLEHNAAIAAEHKDLTGDEIGSLIADLDGRIKKLEAQALDERIRSASVIGMTLDCHIGRFPEECFKFDHAFLDEAGYAPAVKALTLFRQGIPLTLIGDHKQLGPVCEMNDENLGLEHNGPALVWKKSALFVDDLFRLESTTALVDEWLGLPEPRLRSFARANLTGTFRFGQNLTSLLRECVYGGLDFGSRALHSDLQITCLDAVPTKSPSRKRENKAEAECIANYLQAHPEFQNGVEDAWSVLTPYRNQESLLGKLLPNARREGRIMNVHKSQGREWDTVFLSLVDGHFNNPWFTDTTNPQSGGLHVMNTAISRVRRHLILVCDRQFWQSRPDGARQLISRLIEREGTYCSPAQPGPSADKA